MTEDPILEYLVAGWQKVADQRRYGTTIYVFRSQTPLGYSAVTNKAQAIGPVILEIKAQTPPEPKEQSFDFMMPPPLSSGPQS